MKISESMWKFGFHVKIWLKFANIRYLESRRLALLRIVDCVKPFLWDWSRCWRVKTMWTNLTATGHFAGEFQSVSIKKSCFPLGILVACRCITLWTVWLLSLVLSWGSGAEFIRYAWVRTWLMGRNLFSITRIHNSLKNNNHKILIPHSKYNSWV